MSTDEVKYGLIEFLWRKPNEKHSINSLIRICENIIANEIDEKVEKRIKYTIINPLVKEGILESYPNMKFALSPTFALETNKYILIVNFSDNQIETIKEYIIESRFNSLHLLSNNKEIKFRLKQINVIPQLFNLDFFLKYLNNIGNIIIRWETDLTIETKDYLLFNSNNKWISNINYPIGIYKKNDKSYSNKVLKFNNNIWKRIPSNKINIDGFNIAKMYSDIKNEEDLKIEYNSSNNSLKILNPYFPIIIERLLIINTLLNTGNFSGISNRIYFAELSTYKILNNFFSAKIINI
ncbi:MAG: hypothetical protein CFE25_06750 [Chitinophagaceae bacterium BSSC1]|nr:MAG: hypothetical protein CFE25_06750 [Chitinophagaceae bacterium BSSC1]